MWPIIAHGWVGEGNLDDRQWCELRASNLFTFFELQEWKSSEYTSLEDSLPTLDFMSLAKIAILLDPFCVRGRAALGRLCSWLLSRCNLYLNMQKRWALRLSVRRLFFWANLWVSSWIADDLLGFSQTAWPVPLSSRLTAKELSVPSISPEVVRWIRRLQSKGFGVQILDLPIALVIDGISLWSGFLPHLTQ